MNPALFCVKGVLLYSEMSHCVPAGMMTAKVSGVSGWKEVEPNVLERVKAGSTQR